MKTRHMLVVAMMCMLSVLSSACGSAPATPEASFGIVARESDVVEHGDHIDALRQLFGSVLIHAGDVLRVRQGGEALMDFGDHMRLRLFNDTQAGIQSQSAAGVPLDVRMYLEEGGFTGQLMEHGARAVFETPGGATITVLGTEFFVVYDPGTGLTTVGNFQGTVEVAGGGRRISLASGHYVEVPAGEPPGEPVVLSDTRFEFEQRTRDLQSPIAAAAEMTVEPSVQISPTEVTPGMLVTITGRGWQQTDLVFVGLADPAAGENMKLDPTTVVVASSIDDAGGFVAAFHVPADSRWGGLPQVRIVAESSTSQEWASTLIRMAAAPTPGEAQTGTPTPMPTPMPTPTPVPCVQRAGWPAYVVRPGDTLFSIARVTGSTVEELVRANCLPDTRIFVGQRLRVPQLPPTATPTPTSSPAPVASLDATRIALPDQTLGTPGAVRAVALTNVGAAPFDVFGVSLMGSHPNDFFVAGEQCAGVRLQPGQSCVLEVGFRPTLSGSREAVLRVTTSAANAPHDVSLTGVGIGYPAAQIVPETIDFGRQAIGDAGDPRRVTLTNAGSAPLAVEAVKFAPSSQPFDVQNDACTGERLQPGSTCDVWIVFAPNEAGSWRAVLGFFDNAPGSPHSAWLIGNADEPNTPPTATITLPDGDVSLCTSYVDQSEVGHAFIELAGSARDREDGVVAEASLVWSDTHFPVKGPSVTRELGTGTRLYRIDLVSGRHIITLTAIDSGGLRSTARREIAVESCPN